MPKFQPPPLPPQPFLGAAAPGLDKTLAAPSFPWKRWFEVVQQWLSSSGAPKTSVSAGTPIQFQGFEQDGNFLYVCVGPNQWKRIPLNNF